MLEFNYSKTESDSDAQQELAKSEANSKLFLAKLYSRLSNRSSLKSSLILSTIQLEHSGSQQKLLNYLIFGHLSQESQKSIDNNNQALAKPPPLPIKNETIQPKQQQQSAPVVKPTTPSKRDDSNLRREKSLENLLIELSQESDEVTFSQVIVQFLKLNSKFEHTSIILNIIVTIVSEN